MKYEPSVPFSNNNKEIVQWNPHISSGSQIWKTPKIPDWGPHNLIPNVNAAGSTFKFHKTKIYTKKLLIIARQGLQYRTHRSMILNPNWYRSMRIFRYIGISLQKVRNHHKKSSSGNLVCKLPSIEKAADIILQKQKVHPILQHLIVLETYR